MKRMLSANKKSGEKPPEHGPLPTWRSGGFRVDIADREALYQAMDEEPAATPDMPCSQRP